MRYAVLFPGQGSQAVGMGEPLFEARADLLGERADDVLGWSLRRACLEGPADHLTRTDIAQPALYAVSYAMWAEWRERVGQVPVAAAGHSLGEYTALAAAGALDYFDGLALVAERGRSMAEAAAVSASGMAAVIGADADAVEAMCAGRRHEDGRLWVANLNAPGQVVVAGPSDDLEWLQERAADLGLRRVIPLDVTGAFHTPLMEPAVDRLADALRGREFRPPTFEVWSNVDAAPYGDDMAATLLRQLTSPVRFADSLAAMAAAGAEAFLHLGPGNVTAGMAKRTVDGAVTAAVGEPGEVSAAAAEMGLSVE